MERMQVGSTQYYRVHDERNAYWVLSGRSLADPQHVWKVRWDKEGGREFYVNVGDRRKAWRLPDLGPSADDDELPPNPPSTSSPAPAAAAHQHHHPRHHTHTHPAAASQPEPHPASRTPALPTASPGAQAYHRRQQGSLQPALPRGGGGGGVPLQEEGQHQHQHQHQRDQPSGGGGGAAAAAAARRVEVVGYGGGGGGAQAQEAVRFLWGELQKAAAEVDETRRVASDAQRQCDKLRLGLDQASRDLEGAVHEMSGLRDERDYYKRQLTALTEEMHRLTDALEISNARAAALPSQTPPVAPAAPPPPAPLGTTATPTAHSLLPPAVGGVAGGAGGGGGGGGGGVPAKALLVGLAYSELDESFSAVDEIGKNLHVAFHQKAGSVPDVKRFQAYLSACGFCPPAALCLLTDDTPDLSLHPTRANVLAGVEWLVSGAQPGDQLLIQLKAWGLTLEGDGALLPVDCGTAGVLRGDAMLSILSRLPHGVQLVVVADTVQEGTLFDLSHTLAVSPEGTAYFAPTKKGFPLSADVVVVTATSARGADGVSVSQALLEALERRPGGTYIDIAETMCSVMREAGSASRPEISCNRQFDPTRPFSPFSPAAVGGVAGGVGPITGAADRLPQPVHSTAVPPAVPTFKLALPTATSQSNVQAALSMIRSDKERLGQGHVGGEASRVQQVTEAFERHMREMAVALEKNDASRQAKFKVDFNPLDQLAQASVLLADMERERDRARSASVSPPPPSSPPHRTALSQQIHPGTAGAVPFTPGPFGGEWNPPGDLHFPVP